MGGASMTTLILRPAPKRGRTTRHTVHTLTDAGEDRYLGTVEQDITTWRNSHALPAKTRDEAAHKLAEAFLLPGPYHVELLAARVRRTVKQCGRGRGRAGWSVTVRLERVS